MGREIWAPDGNGFRPPRSFDEGGHLRRSPRSRGRRSPGPHEDPNSHLRFLLDPLVKQRQAFIQTGAFDVFRGFGEGEEEGQRLLDVFRTSSFFDIVYTKALQESRNMQEPNEREFLRLLAGNTFETLAIAYMTAQNADDGKVVLPPERVHTLYHKHVYPEVEVTHFPFGVDVVQRHGQPDGVVVDPATMKVEGAIECTVSSLPRKFQRQWESFVRTLRTNKLFPLDAVLTFSVPAQDRPERFGSDFTIEQLPVTHDQFREFILWMYKEHTGDDGLSLQNLLEEAQRDQRFRDLGITVERTITPGVPITFPAH